MNQKKNRPVLIICCVLLIALFAGLFTWSYMSHQDDKVTIGRMLAFNFESQKFALHRLQSNLEDSIDVLLLQQTAQIEALKSYNFFETGVKKLPWDSLYEDLFKEVKLAAVMAVSGSQAFQVSPEAEEARRKAIELTKEIIEKIEEVEDSCVPANYQSGSGDHVRKEKQKYLNYYKLLDEIFY